MTIFRSKQRKQKVVLTNSGNSDLSILTEPWAKEVTVKPGDRLELESDVDELQDPHNPLNFEAWANDSHVSIWCPPGTELKVLQKSET